MSWKSLIAYAGAALLALSVGSARAADGPIVVKFPHDVPVTQIKGMGAERLKKLVAERMKGRMVVQVYPNGQLYPNERDALAALQQGAVQLVQPTFAKWTPVVPAFSVFELPFVVTSERVMRKAMDSPEIGGKLFVEKLAEKGLFPLEVAPNGFRQMDMRKKRITKLEDFAGLKVRIQDSTTFTAFMKYAHAIPVPIAFAETYSAVSAGIVDGWEGPLDGIYSGKLYEVAPVISMTNHVFNAYLMATNKQWWDSLPPDIRTDFKKILDEVADWQWDVAAKMQKEGREKLLKAGVKIYEIDPAEKQRMVKYFRGMHEQFKDVVGQETLDAMYRLADEDAKQTH
ncbi:MAG: TRAP transporter substrate-binding protein [Acetobacteraceae bacterium]